MPGREQKQRKDMDGLEREKYQFFGRTQAWGAGGGFGQACPMSLQRERHIRKEVSGGF